MSSPTLDSFRGRFSSYSAPIIVFNKSHSGSRVLARLLEAAGVFMGSRLMNHTIRWTSSNLSNI